MTRRAPIPSNMNASHRRPDRRPYGNLRRIIARAQAGDIPKDPRPREEPPVIIGNPEPLEVPASKPGEIIAKRLVDARGENLTQIVTTENTEREMRTAQQAGTRWLLRAGYPTLRLHRRIDGDRALWTLATRSHATKERTAA